MTAAEDTCCTGDDRAHGSDPEQDRWERDLAARIGGDYLLLGAGNDLMGDDGAGAVAARELRERGVEEAVEVGTCPENYLGYIRACKPSHIVVLDACDIGEEPGTISLRGAGEFEGQGASTHAAGVQPLAAYLSRTCTARRWVLAVQPARVEFGVGLSAPVLGAVRRIVSSPVWEDMGSADAG